MSVFGRWLAVAATMVTVLMALSQVSGQPALAQAGCERAEALFNAGLYAEAKAAYDKLLEADATYECALKKIEEATRKADEAQQQAELAAIRTLLQQGRFAEATTALDAYRQKYPAQASPTVTPTIEAGASPVAVTTPAATTTPTASPTDQDIAPYWDYTPFYAGLDRSWITIQATERFLLVLVEMLATVVLAPLLLVLLWVTIGRMWGFVRARLAPSLQVEAFTGSSANVDVAALVRVALHRYSSPGGGNQRARSLNLVTGPVDAISLPEVKSAPESTQIFTSMLNWLLPPHIITLTGKIQPAGIRGIGISLELTDSQSKRQLASYTLWQDEFEPDTPAKPDDADPKPYLRLAEPAAVWAMFSYFQDRWEHGPWWQAGRRLCLSGTSDWQSYALLQAGTNWVRDKEREKGRQLYRRALTKDPRNYGALTNLASLVMQEETADDDQKQKLYEYAAEELRAVCKSIERAGRDRRDPAWYIASYRLGIAESELSRLAKASGNSQQADEHAKKALATLNCAFEQASKQLHVEEIARAWGPLYQLARLLIRPVLWLCRQFLRLVIVLRGWCALLILHFGRRSPDNALIRWLLAHPAWRGRQTVQEIGDEVTLEFLRTMRFTVGISHSRALAEFRNELHDQKIILEVSARDCEGLTAREQYNLACYYTQRAARHDAAARKAREAHLEKEAEEAEKARCTSFKKALKALESGLGLPSGVADRWPLLDSALKPLRDHEPSKARFAELLKAYNGIPAKEPNALADLRGIGSYYAGKLKEKDYGTPDLLSPLAHSAGKRSDLARLLTVSPVLVLRWVRLAQLYQVANEQSGMVNLLELAGVETLSALAQGNARALATRLGDLNQDAKLVETAPTAESIQKWIDSAKAAAR